MESFGINALRWHCRLVIRLVGFAVLAAGSPSLLAQGGAKVNNDADVTACVRVGGQICKTVRNLDRCNAWHEEHASLIGADTVVIADSDEHGQVLGFIGKRSEVVANYYRCKNPEAITLPPNEWEEESGKYVGYAGEGSTSITGQAFLRQRGGGVVTCAGSPVIAVPVGHFFDRISPAYLQDLQPGALSLIRQTTCDAAGNFRFSRLPAEKWRVVTNVTWETADRLDKFQGGVLSRVAPSEDAPDPIYLTNTDLVR